MDKQIMENLGNYIETKILEREVHLKAKGKVDKKRKLTKSYIATHVLNVSVTWFCSVLNGEKFPNDEMLVNLANFLEIDENELFKIAHRMPPSLYEKHLNDFLNS